MLVLISSADRYIPCGFLQIAFGRYFFEISVKNQLWFCHVMALRIAHHWEGKKKGKQLSRTRCCSMQGLHIPFALALAQGSCPRRGVLGVVC